MKLIFRELDNDRKVSSFVTVGAWCVAGCLWSFLSWVLFYLRWRFFVSFRRLCFSWKRSFLIIFIRRFFEIITVSRWVFFVDRGRFFGVIWGDSTLGFMVFVFLGRVFSVLEFLFFCDFFVRIVFGRSRLFRCFING